MWAQLITTRLKPGREGELPRLVEQLQATEQPGSGLVRSIATQDQNDPNRVVMHGRLRERGEAPGPASRIPGGRKDSRLPGRRWPRSSTARRSSWT